MVQSYEKSVNKQSKNKFLVVKRNRFLNFIFLTFQKLLIFNDLQKSYKIR